MVLEVDKELLPLKVSQDGTVRVGGTRVSLELVVQAYLDGASAEEIAEQFPSLRLADVYSVLGYYLRHKADVDDYVEERQRRGKEVRGRIESGQRLGGVRERLLSRRIENSR